MARHFTEVMSYCTKCGKRLKATEKYCSNCGNPLSPLYTGHFSQATHNSNKSSIGIWVTVFVMLCILGVMLSSNGDSISSNTNSSITSLLKKQKSQGEIQAIKNLNEMRNAIDNTVWTHTKAGDLFWFKLEFKGGKVKIYRAFPSDGKWTFEEECPFTVEEGRFIDDGKRYIAAVIKTKDLSTPPKFIITNGHLNWLGFIDAGGFVLGDYEWD